MAIKLRRGAYADFDPSKMDEAEVAVVQSGDPSSNDGKAVYLAFTPGQVKRLATHEDIQNEIAMVTQDIADNLTQQIEAAVADDLEAAQTAATNANTSAQTASTKASEAAQSASQAAETVANIIDNTLTQTGKAADAKKVGDEIDSLKGDLDDLAAEVAAIERGLSNEVKEALLNCFEHVSWDDANGETYKTILRNALYNKEPIVLIANYTPDDGTIFVGDEINDLKSNLVVSTTISGETVILNDDDYTLVGSLIAGENTITVSYLGAITTFKVTAVPYTWKYTPSDGLLSEQEYITFTQNASGATETVTDNELEIDVPITTGSAFSWFRRYGFTNLTTSNGILRIKAKNINAMLGEDGETLLNMGFRPQLSNGSVGAQMFINAKPFENDMLIGVVYNNGSTQSSLMTQYKAQEYHDFELQLNGNIQNLIIDGESLFKGDASQNYAVSNVIFVQANTDKRITVNIKEIIYADLSGGE